MDNNDLIKIQDTIGGYEFKNLDLLQQAFVRRSYSAENGGQNNEVLEFIGDKVLDFAVVQLLAKKYGSFTDSEEFNEFKSERTEGELTEIKRKLVEKSMLASRIDELDLNQYLIMGNGDAKENVERNISVKEDLFEAILGAVAIDSEWDNNVIMDTVEAMLEPDSSLENDYEENYIGFIQEWCLGRYNEIPWFHYAKAKAEWYMPFEGVSDMYEPKYRKNEKSGILVAVDQAKCLLKLGDYGTIFRSYGLSKSEARKNVCRLAYKYLEKNDELLSINDEIDNPNIDESISQLEILARRGYFNIPEYSFTKGYDDNGNPIWFCESSIPEEQISARAEGSSKKVVKKEVAYSMLCRVLNINGGNK